MSRRTNAEPTVTAADVRAARERFDDAAVVRRTPVDTSRAVGRAVDADVRLKMEHLQRTGSFKTRGAYNTLSRLDGAGRVVAASAGNHAQGVALAATRIGLDATIVMPETAPLAKVDATAGYGADVELAGTAFADAVERARELAAAPDAVFVHAFEDPDIVAGQGTVGLEIVEQVPDVDTVIVPVGGGGLIGGIGAALADTDVRVVGVQAATAAALPESLEKGRPAACDADTIADGIATGSVSELTLGLVRRHVDEVVTVTDSEIAGGILTLLERAKQLVEGAGAAPVAALLSGRIDVAGETVVPVLSGGNLDMSMLGTILTHELTARSQLLRLRVRIDDGPGRMHDISGVIGEQGANIRTVHHYRSDARLDVGEAFVVYVVETGGRTHARRITDAIREAGYEVERVNG